MAEVIVIEGLEVAAQIGVTQEERLQWQRMRISLEFFVDNTKAAAEKDDLALTVDYDMVAQKVCNIVQSKPRCLIETLAHDVIHKLLEEFKIEEVKIEVRKYPLRNAEYVAFRLGPVKKSKTI